MRTVKEQKEYLKSMAKEIRELKNQRKSSPYGFVYGLDDLRRTFRFEHIAYCLFRGTPAEKIERDNPFITYERAYINGLVANIITSPKSDNNEVQHA